MSTRDEIGSPGGAGQDEGSGSGRLKGAAEQAGEAVTSAKEGVQARASETVERAKDALGDTGKKAAHVAGRMARAGTDVELRGSVDSRTERALHQAGDAVSGAAPAIGRGVESTLRTTGTVLHKIAGPLATVVGAIAGKVGGWWSSASEAIDELPAEEEQACRVYFESYTVRPAEMTYDDARTAFAIGHLAARNPSYSGRPFDELEPDLRHGLGQEQTGGYDSLRDFARYGYERGSGSASADRLG